MTKAHDIQELIVDESSGTAERHALEAVAATLQDSLTREVPFRPEFEARLRAQLVAEARRTLTPWYRRPAIWGPSVSVAAAAAVLAVGLQVYRGAPGGSAAQPAAPFTEHVADSLPVAIAPVPTTSFYVNSVAVPAIVLPDEVIPAGDAVPAPESVTGLDLSRGLKVFVLGSMPDMAQFTRIATGLGFSQQPQRIGLDYTVTAGGREFTMSADGHVQYADLATGQDTGAPADAPGAQAVARRFLETASLPVPDLQPAVAKVTTRAGQRIFIVTYTPRVEGRPVANGRTVVTVSDRSRVLRADSYVYAREQDPTVHSVITPAAALAEAAKRGGARFAGDIDLVYVRTVTPSTVYVQPSWRVFGTGDGGLRVVRYVPAVAPE